jgi:hypothetical protein
MQLQLNETSFNLDVTQQVSNLEAYQTAPSVLDVQVRGFQAPITKINQYAYQLTQSDIDEKKVFLSGEFAPQGGFIKFQPRGAPCVIITLDFIFIEGENSISWEGLGLDGFLEKDNWVEISYSFFYH